MLETWLRARDVRHQVEITFTTYEQSFVQAFGPKLHELVTEEFAVRGITGHTGWRVMEAGLHAGARLLAH
ncbi:hypothetical protein ACFQ1S_12760 [Kibdelosporangium lantanae]|uniref:Uncharacterized protein n=1 Tax=Kibdelosporangium lantanae TaxID=1497396 RepID=A0ABW3M8N7_9PSEU